jgi:hypothetical protein
VFVSPQGTRHLQGFATGKAKAPPDGDAFAWRSGCYRFLPFSRWDSAEPAAVFDFFEVRPSRSTFDAALAARGLVTFLAIASLPFPLHRRAGLPASAGPKTLAAGPDGSWGPLRTHVDRAR